MSNPCRLFLSLALVSSVFSSCGGATEGDARDGGDEFSVGGAGADGSAETDGAADVGDAASEVNDGPSGADGGDIDADATVQTCLACSVTSYSCGQLPMESFDLAVGNAEANGCLVTRSLPNSVWELHCEPLEVCGLTTCWPVAQELDGTITWTPPGGPKVTCYPKYK